jgi:hypothetical protein
MDLISDSESKSGTKQPDPNEPDYEKSSTDEESEAPKPERKARAAKAGSDEDMADDRSNPGATKDEGSQSDHERKDRKPAAASRKNAKASPPEKKEDPAPAAKNAGTAKGPGGEETETDAKGSGEEATPAAASTTIRTHCGYDWAVNEVVQYNRMGKSKDCVALEAIIVKFPIVLPTTDYYAKAYILVLATPDQQPICVNVRSLEKIVKTEKSQRNSTLRQEEASAPIDVDSDQDTVPVSNQHSNKKRKAESPSPGGTPRSPSGTSNIRWAEQSVEHIAQKASLSVPDAKTKEAFRILLQAMIDGLNGPSIAEMTAARTKLERKHRKLRAAHTTATTELAEAVARVTQRGTQIAVLRTKVRTLEDQAKEGEAVAAEAQDRAQELAKTKRLNEMLTGQVKALSNRTQELQDRIQALERTDGAAQGSAEGEAAKNQELEKLTAALAEKDKEIKRLKAALLAFV